MRMFDELGRLIARLSSKRKKGDTDDAPLEIIVYGMQRLFGLDADEIFALTPEQHFAILCDDDSPEFARDKVLMYAALCMEAGHAYARQGNHPMARASFTNALRFTLKARAKFSTEGLPDYTPNADELLKLLADQPLDPETAKLVGEQMA